MNKDEIIQMARKARIEQDGEMFYSFRNSDKDQDVHIDDLISFAQAAYAAGAAAEREACAKVVEASPSYDWHRFACEAAAAIRARGEATLRRQG